MATQGVERERDSVWKTYLVSYRVNYIVLFELSRRSPLLYLLDSGARTTTLVRRTTRLAGLGTL